MMTPIPLSVDEQHVATPLDASRLALLLQEQQPTDPQVRRWLRRAVEVTPMMHGWELPTAQWAQTALSQLAIVQAGAAVQRKVLSPSLCAFRSQRPGVRVQDLIRIAEWRATLHRTDLEAELVRVTQAPPPELEAELVLLSLWLSGGMPEIASDYWG